MAMTPIKRAVAVTGSYKDRSGNEKKRYANVGTLFQYDDGGMALKIESLPVGGEWNGFVSFFDIDDKKDGQAGGRSSGSSGGGGSGSVARGRGDRQNDLNDDIPF